MTSDLEAPDLIISLMPKRVPPHISSCYAKERVMGCAINSELHLEWRLD